MDVARVHFSSHDRVFAQAADQFAIEARRIAQVLPDADIQHVGGTSVPGCRTKGDLDVQVRVPAAELGAVVAKLGAMYDTDDANPPAEGRVSFRGEGDPSVGVQLTAIGWPEDKFWRFRELLLARPDLCSAFDQLKADHEGAPMAQYRRAKGAFFVAMQASPEYEEQRDVARERPPE